MTTITKGWPPQRRRAQAERIQRLKPWLHATGPRTAAGKARSRLNAVRHSLRSQAMRRLKHVMRAQRLYLKALSHGERVGCGDTAYNFGAVFPSPSRKRGSLPLRRGEGQHPHYDHQTLLNLSPLN